MNLNTLLIVIFSSILLVGGSLFYFNTRGPSITDIKAALVCAKVVENNVAVPFKVLRYEFSNKHSLLYVKSEILLIYNNQLQATAECIIKRNNTKSKIIVSQALIVNHKGSLLKVSDVSVSVLDN